MAMTAAVAIGGALLGSQIMKKPAMPNLVVEQPPKPADAAPGADSAAAANQQRKRNAGAVGVSDTIKTGPNGLGEVGAQNVAPKTVLGY